MSSLRKASKAAAGGRAHKERSQPGFRARFGLLEKHKDYVLRAKDFHKKQENLQKLKEKAANRNPDEFFFKMINSQTVKGVHRGETGAKVYTEEEMKLLRSQDAGYLVSKAQSEMKKVGRLRSSVLPVSANTNKHVFFVGDGDEVEDTRERVVNRPAEPLHVPKVRKKLNREMQERSERAAKLKDMASAVELQKQKLGSGKPSWRMLAMPCAPKPLSFLKGLPLLKRVVPKSQQWRNLSTVATAAPLSRQFTSVPGFSQIAEPVLEGLLLSEVVKSLPKEVFEINDLKAWKTVAITLGSIALGYAALAVAPWYLYPLVNAYLGTAMTGLFVVGHDCGHNSFSKNQLINDIVGTVMFMPLMYPFEPWRIKLNTHHAHTNKLIIDTVWQPFRPYMYDRSKGFPKFAMEAAMGPLWWMASVGHWLFWHFDLTKYRPRDVPKVKVSLAAVAAFGVFALLPLLVLTGPIGFLKWWVVPWLGFHFWMSTS